MSEATEIPDLESMLLSEGVVSAEQLERARRVSKKLKKPRRVAEVLLDTGQLSRTEYERALRLHRQRLSLAAILVEERALDASGLERYEAARRERPEAPERELLVDSGLVAEQHFLGAVASKFDFPMVSPEVGLADLELFSRVSIPYLLRHRVFPLRSGDGVLTAIFADPLDLEVVSEIERIFQLPVRPCCASADSVLRALNEVQRLHDGPASDDAPALQYRELSDRAHEGVTGEIAVTVLDHLLLRAVQERASDVHIEPLERKLRVRIRVDGVLRPLTELPSDFAPQLISRVKALAGADLAERRLHQDGRIGIRFDGRAVDIRVSTYASMFGESIVMRLLNRRRGLVPLEDIGFEPLVLAALRDVALRATSGLVLVSGPADSGKTTTLYSFVDYVNHPDVKTITAEDPVEYVLEGVTQCSVNSKSGPTFADSLAAIVRQDPDIIVVGELRDSVAARMAIEAALTGRRVFSTFHTEDAVGTIVRLLDMGCEPFLVASTLTCIVAQRLVRRVCTECRESDEVTLDDLRFLGLERPALAGASFARGAGCDACGGTGYRDRVGLHEVLLPDDDFRDAILRRASSRELRAIARKLPVFQSLQESGLLKAAQSVTTVSEVVANAPRDTSCRPLVTLREVAGLGRLM